MSGRECARQDRKTKSTVQIADKNNAVQCALAAHNGSQQTEEKGSGSRTMMGEQKVASNLRFVDESMLVATTLPQFSEIVED